MAQQTAVRRQTLWILWGGFTAAVFVYGVVVVSAVEAGAQPVAAPTSLRMLFVATALLLGGASIWCRRRATGETQFLPATQTASLDRFQTDCILTWGLSEAVAVAGLLLGLLTRDLGAFLPFGGSAVVLLVIHRPSIWPQWTSVPE